MSEYTPGPWRLYRNSRGLDVRADNGTVVALVFFSQGEANARLIEVAPELLALVKETLGWPEEDEYGNALEEEYATPAYRAYRQRLRAAISKAESGAAQTLTQESKA